MTTKYTSYAFAAGYSAGAVTSGYSPAFAPPLLDQRTTVNFDDQTGDFGVLTDYAGFSWEGIGYLLPSVVEADYGVTGYTNGLVSDDYVAYTRYDDIVPGDAIGRVGSDSGANFTLSSVYMTAGWRDGLEVTITGYDDGEVVYTRTVTIGDDEATRFRLNITDVDLVEFTATGGTPSSDDPNADGVNIVFDNFVFETDPGAITGTVFNDLDGDGVQDRGEKGLRGRTVFLDVNENGTLDQGEVTAQTNRSGTYTFEGLTFGAYDVVVEVPRNFTATSPVVTDYGYESDSARYKFIDISDTGTEVVFSNDDDGYGLLETSAPISFYGREFSDLYISTNGFVSFEPSGAYANGPLPNSALPNGMIAALWNDYNLTVSGTVYALDDAANERIIVQWDDVALYNGSADQTNTFQVIIGYDGDIKFAYKNVIQDAAVTATVGVESWDGLEGVTASDGANPANRSALLFTSTETFTYGVAQDVVVDSGQTTSGVDFGLARVPSAAAFDGPGSSDMTAIYAEHHASRIALMDVGHVALV